MKISLNLISHEQIDDPEFTIMFEKENVYEILVDNCCVGYLSLNSYRTGMLINNIMICHIEQGKGYGKLCLDYLKGKYPILYGYPVEESKGFWDKIGVNYLNNEMFIINETI